jgi:chitin disaccharide deacetylase
MDAHQHGILTSASLLVKTPGAEQAVALAAAFPGLSLGLPVDLRNELEETPVSPGGVRESLRWQFRRFEELVGRPPTHLDSHHNVHRGPASATAFH